MKIVGCARQIVTPTGAVLITRASALDAWRRASRESEGNTLHQRLLGATSGHRASNLGGACALEGIEPCALLRQAGNI